MECIYRDLEYARSLVKHLDDSDFENHPPGSRSPSRSAPTQSSSGSARGPASEDWSVISDPEERRTSGDKKESKRNSNPPDGT